MSSHRWLAATKSSEGSVKLVSLAETEGLAKMYAKWQLRVDKEDTPVVAKLYVDELDWEEVDVSKPTG